jgi:hypothetical protein
MKIRLFATRGAIRYLSEGAFEEGKILAVIIEWFLTLPKVESAAITARR